MKADVVLSRYKRPGEEFRLAWDFVNDVEGSDTPSTYEVKAYDAVTGADVSSTFIQDPTIAGNVLEAQVQGGTSGRDYLVRFELTTIQGDIFQRIVRVSVRA